MSKTEAFVWKCIIWFMRVFRNYKLTVEMRGDTLHIEGEPINEIQRR